MSSLCLHGNNELFMVNLDLVLYIQADDHYAQVFYATGMHFMVPFGLARIEALLAEQPAEAHSLVRLGRKYIVNLRRVFRINTISETVHMADNLGGTVPLHVAKPVLRELINQLGGGL